MGKGGDVNAALGNLYGGFGGLSSGMWNAATPENNTESARAAVCAGSAKGTKGSLALPGSVVG